MAIRVDVALDAGDGRVVRWNRSVNIQPQNFSLVERPVARLQLSDGRHALGPIRLAEIGQLVGAHVADREIQLPIGTDEQTPALVIRAGRQAGQDVAGIAQRQRARIVGEAHDFRPTPDRRRIRVGVVGVGDVHVVVPRALQQVGVERHPEQPARSVSDEIGDRNRRCLRAVRRPDARDASGGPFRHPQVAVRAPDHLKRIHETRRHDALLEHRRRLWRR